MKKCILAIDDEEPILHLLSRIMGREGHKVITSKSGGEGLSLALKENPDLIILDLNLPDLSGEEVCRQIRQESRLQFVPVLILTGKTDEGLEARCLNGGADAYLRKPFELQDILAYVRALLRRARLDASKEDTICHGQITIRVPDRTVFWNGRCIQSFPREEFDLLRQLVMQTPKVIDRGTLTLKVWGVPHQQLHQRTLDTHIQRIRKKLGPKGAVCLKTVPAVGFQWLEESGDFKVDLPE